MKQESIQIALTISQIELVSNVLIPKKNIYLKSLKKEFHIQFYGIIKQPKDTKEISFLVMENYIQKWIFRKMMCSNSKKMKFSHVPTNTDVGYSCITCITLNNNVAGIAYTLNDDNQRTAVALNDGSAWAYGYDTKGQLLTAVREDSQNTTLNDMDYAYDGIGNRTEIEEDTVAKEYVSNLLNQYTSIETTSATPPVTETPTYDADGNMLTNGPWTYTWNTESRLTTAASGTTVLEFQYDYMGRRIEKKVTENSVVTKQENYVYDGYKLVAIYDALNSNALIMTFVWQPIGLDVPLCMTYDGNTYYYLTDGNKNVTGLFDSTGTRVATYLYGPFGQVLSSTGAMASTNPFRFSSEFHDDETVLVYYNYRYYSPILGRWTRRDPIGENWSLNLYDFTANNPVNTYDQLGNFTIAKALSLYYYKSQEAKLFAWYNPELNRKQYEAWVNSLSDQEKFDIWVEVEAKDLSWIQELPKCPPCMHSRDKEIWEDPQKVFMADKYHPGAIYEIRTLKATSKGAGNQCTYDKHGILIRTKYGSGTADRLQATRNPISAVINTINSQGHIGEDVEPFDLAYRLDGNKHGINVDKYISVRPFTGAL